MLLLATPTHQDITGFIKTGSKIYNFQMSWYFDALPVEFNFILNNPTSQGKRKGRKYYICFWNFKKKEKKKTSNLHYISVVSKTQILELLSFKTWNLYYIWFWRWRNWLKNWQKKHKLIFEYGFSENFSRGRRKHASTSFQKFHNDHHLTLEIARFRWLWF